MSVVELIDKPQRAGGFTSERKGPIFELTNRRYKRRLVAWTNDVNDGPETILLTPGCPNIGDSYAIGNDADAEAVCIDVQVNPTESPWVWEIEASYDSSRLVDEALENPLNLPPEITWSSNPWERPLQRDYFGVPFANSAGERIDPPQTVEDNRPVLTVSRNEPFFDPGIAQAYTDAVNSDLFWRAGPYQAKVREISGRMQVDIGISYWKVNYVIDFKLPDFAYYILDMGFRDATGVLFRDPFTQAALANATILNGRGFAQYQTFAALAGPIGPAETVIAVQNPPGYTGGGQPGSYFPPGPSAGSANWLFEIKIDNEIMQVVAGFNTNNWLVVRGYSGSVPTGHAAGATVYLQPYFLRFLPYKILPFSALNLPTG